MSEYENRVCKLIQDRAAMGLKKYGVGVDRTDLSPLQWLQHAQDEAMDLAIYLERMKDELKHRLARQQPLPLIPVEVTEGIEVGINEVLKFSDLQLVVGQAPNSTFTVKSHPEIVVRGYLPKRYDSVAEAQRDLARLEAGAMPETLGFECTEGATDEPMEGIDVEPGESAEINIAEDQTAQEKWNREYLAKHATPTVEDKISCAECGHEYARDTCPYRCTCGNYL
jgi:hypothetical protein